MLQYDATDLAIAYVRVKYELEAASVYDEDRESGNRCFEVLESGNFRFVKSELTRRILLQLLVEGCHHPGGNRDESAVGVT